MPKKTPQRDTPVSGGLPPGKALVVVDAHEARDLAKVLGDDGVEVVTATTASVARTMMQRESIDLAVVDLQLGGVDTTDLVAGFIERETPIIALLPSDLDPGARANILELGVADYVHRPFQFRELTLRVRRLLERGRGTSRGRGGDWPRYKINDWVLDTERRALISPAGKGVRITAAEFELLRLLVSQPGRAVTRQAIANAVGGRTWTPEDRSIDVGIGHIRRKLGQTAPSSGPIKSVRGVGYVLAAKVVRLAIATLCFGVSLGFVA